LIIKGKYTRGQGCASNTIAMQLKFFKNLPHVERLHPGTINIIPHKQLQKLPKFQFIYKGIAWHPNYHREDFGFIIVKRFTINNCSYTEPAYLYIASNSRTLLEKKQLELLTVRLSKQKLSENDTIEIEIN
jgi:hypothetical protein